MSYLVSTHPSGRVLQLKVEANRRVAARVWAKLRGILGASRPEETAMHGIAAIVATRSLAEFGTELEAFTHVERRDGARTHFDEAVEVSIRTRSSQTERFA